MGDVRQMDKVDEAGFYLYEIEWCQEWLEWYSCTFEQFLQYNLQKDQLGIVD